jgi:hypothetical protein
MINSHVTAPLKAYQININGHWKGRGALKIETFLGPEMAMSKNLR